MEGFGWQSAGRKHHVLQQGDDCALCDQCGETTDDLLVSCVYSREVWCHKLRLIALDLVSTLCRRPVAFLVARSTVHHPTVAQKGSRLVGTPRLLAPMEREKHSGL
jgi:hypothetical protein